MIRIAVEKFFYNIHFFFVYSNIQFYNVVKLFPLKCGEITARSEKKKFPLLYRFVRIQT